LRVKSAESECLVFVKVLAAVCACATDCNRILAGDRIFLPVTKAVKFAFFLHLQVVGVAS